MSPTEATLDPLPPVHIARLADPADVAALTAGVALARGDFMAGFTLRDAPAFDSWQRYQAAELRRLRDLTRYRADLVGVRTAEKNRVEKLLEDAQIKLSVVASDIFGVSGRAMTTYLSGPPVSGDPNG